MKENVTFLKTEVAEGYYRINYRCSNCGTIFQFDIQKGKIASETTCRCPHCAVMSGTVKVGVFTVLKYNPKMDEVTPPRYR